VRHSNREPHVHTIPIKQLRRDGGTQPRALLDTSVIADYTEAVLAGGTFPPVTVIFDGTTHWLADGFHRVAAAEAAGRTEIAADVRQGTHRDAVLISVGANAEHGLRRTNADKRRAVTTLLSDPEWSRWSDREIARKAGVGHVFVNSMRKELSVHREQIATPDTRLVERGGTTYEMDVTGIGERAQQTSSARAAHRGIWRPCSGCPTSSLC
jgi:hypothetical protein